MKYVSLFLLFLVFGACKKAQLAFYDGTEYLYFKKQSDTVLYSFEDEEGTVVTNQMELLIPIVLVGNADRLEAPLNYSVEFRAKDLKVIGMEGDFVKEYFSLQLRQQIDTLKLTIFRDSLFRDTTVIVQVSLYPPSPYDAVIGLAENLLYTRSYDIYISHQYATPRNWAYYEPYFGSFSSKKMRTLSVFLEGDSPQELYASLEYTYYAEPDAFIEIAEKFFQYLKEQKEKGSLVLERNGYEMLAGPLMY